MKKTKFTYACTALAALSLWACNPEAKQATEEATASSASTPAVTTANETAKEETPANPNGPVISFEEKEFDFGNIKEGDVITHVFKFTNTGKEPLVIQNASAPCGCTVPKWPKEPIAPGASGEINVQFNSKGKSGQQNKVVSVVANTQPDVSTVTLKGNVEPGVSAMNGPMAQ